MKTSRYNAIGYETMFSLCVQLPVRARERQTDGPQHHLMPSCCKAVLTLEWDNCAGHLLNVCVCCAIGSAHRLQRLL